MFFEQSIEFGAGLIDQRRGELARRLLPFSGEIPHSKVE
jgi:hypothetical protein